MSMHIMKLQKEYYNYIKNGTKQYSHKRKIKQIKRKKQILEKISKKL